MEGGRCDVAFATGLLRPGWAGCDAALAAGLAQPAIVRARGVLTCETGRESMSVTAGVWWRVGGVLGGMVRGLEGYRSGGASREASSCGGKGLCLFASVRSVIEYMHSIESQSGRAFWPRPRGAWRPVRALLWRVALRRAKNTVVQ